MTMTHTSVTEDNYPKILDSIREADQQDTRHLIHRINALTSSSFDDITITYHPTHCAYRTGSQPTLDITHGEPDGTINLTITHDSCQATYTDGMGHTREPTTIECHHADQLIQYYLREAIHTSERMPELEKRMKQTEETIDEDMDEETMLRRIDWLAEHFPGAKHTPDTNTGTGSTGTDTTNPLF